MADRSVYVLSFAKLRRLVDVRLRPPFVPVLPCLPPDLTPPRFLTDLQNDLTLHHWMNWIMQNYLNCENGEFKIDFSPFIF